ncbi:GIY-YIG nuclease family protein [Cribrihabitans sp. XS_ASV171]
MPRDMHVYIMTNRPAGVLYIGITGNLRHRVWQHRLHMLPGFTDRYNLERLVWYEAHEVPATAIQREKSLKRWRRQWKLDLVQAMNPTWRDLWAEIHAP